MTQQKERPPRYRGGRARYAERPKPIGDAIGVRGLTYSGNYIYEQWRNALKDRSKRLNIYMEMREDI